MKNLKQICSINLNEAEGRQTISWDPEDHMLYSSVCDDPVDGYTYDTLEEAVDACDAMWGRSDLMGAWELEWIEEKGEIIMYNEYYITMDSFGQDCPTNWEEIAAWLNEKIDMMEDILDENGDLTVEGRDMIDALWESYCAGDLEDAPAPIMD